MPTVHSLVALEDSPPVVLSLEDIEIANFERVQFQLRNFDLTFVFKDFNRPVLRIDAIPIKSLEAIKTWLNNCGIVFFETKTNLLWKKLLKQISKDLEGFYEDGAWNTILGEDDGSEDEGEEESGSEFEPDAEEEGDDDSEEYLSDEVSEDESSSAAEDSEDEGEDWDEVFASPLLPFSCSSLLSLAPLPLCSTHAIGTRQTLCPSLAFFLPLHFVIPL
jgi:nucleosome binding factor SPN SPT16 subunit